MELADEQGFTKRQLFGIEYMQYTKEVDRETELTRNGNEFSYELHGKAKEVPEIENVVFSSGGIKSPVVYHDLDKFLVTHNESGKQIDFVAITPSDWTQKSVELISPEYKAPEVHFAFGQYQVIDVKRNECVTSNAVGVDDPNDTDIAVKAGLWNTLIARFIQEIGDPTNDEGRKGMRDSVLQRRQEVFDALNGTTDENPQEVALKSFKI